MIASVSLYAVIRRRAMMSDLNAQQQAIVTAPTQYPMLITAGAGTGKTRTLTERFAYLLDHHKIASDRILLLTFTKKAAAEMKERVLKLCDLPLVERERLWIHTFHAFCARILRDEAVYLNIPEDFEPIDPGEQQVIYESVLSELHSLSGDFNDLAGRLRVFDIALYKQFINDSYSIIEKLREKLVQPHEFKGYIEANYAPAERDSDRACIMSQMLVVLYSRFNERLDELGLKDFSKLIMDVILLLRDNKAVRAKYRKKFRFVMVDEFQDTSHNQFELLRLVCEDKFANLTVVGDPRQSIYQWRDADPRNLQWISTEVPNLLKKDLQVNYRSYGDILDLANALLGQTEHASLARLKPRDEKWYHSPAIFCFENKDEEPAYIAAQIKRLLDSKKYTPGDIAILLRQTKGRAGRIEQELESLGVPYYTSGSGSFFEQEDVKDLLAYLRVLNNPLDNLALVRILQRRPYSMSDGQVYELYRASKENHCSLFVQLSQYEPFAVFYNELSNLSANKSQMPVVDLIYSVIDRLDVRSILYRDAASYIGARERLAKFINLAGIFDRRMGQEGLERFIELTSKGSLIAEDDELLEQVQAKGCVRIMTLHKAKGLEFPVVFLAGLQSFDKVLRDIKRNTGRMNSFFLDDRHKLIHKDMPEYESVKNRTVDDQSNEWWRLYYVGITRAQEQLYLTGADLSDFTALLDQCNPLTFEIVDEIPPVDTHDGAEIDLVAVREDVAHITARLAEPPVDQPKPQQIVRLSCSTLHLYEQCPHYYYLRYILGVPEPVPDAPTDQPRLRWDSMGTVIHETIELYHKHDKSLSINQIADQKMSRYPAETISAEIVYGALDYYMETPYATESVHQFHSEYPFTLFVPFAGGTIELRGQIDRLYRATTSCRIIDFKTGMQRHDEQYTLQMQLYALACNTLFGVDTVTAELVYLNRKEVQTISMTVDDFEICRKRLELIAHNIAEKKFEAHSNDTCRYCAYINDCRRNVRLRLVDGRISDTDYYRHFYDLVDREEQRCCGGTDDAAVQYPVAFIGSVPADTSSKNETMLIEYQAPANDLQIRQGDTIALYRTDRTSVRVRVADVQSSAIRVISDELNDWQEFVAISEWYDRLPFVRMKNNLFDFLRSDSTLKQILLQQRPPQNIDYSDVALAADYQLDQFQRQAVQMAVATHDFLIVHGPPGTGKTVTIAAMVYELMKRGKRVLVSAYTNRAVDAIVGKILDIIDKQHDIELNLMFRIGNAALVDRRIAPLLVPDTFSPDRISIAIRDALLVAGTSTAIRPELFTAFNGQFDTAIIDEASQMPEPSALSVINHTGTLIMVGDDKQLPPIITDPYARDHGLGTSLFERMKRFTSQTSLNNIVVLKNQYRMNETLMEFSSRLFYDGQVHAGTMDVASRKLSGDTSKLDGCAQWIRCVLDPDKPLVFVPVDGYPAARKCIESLIAALSSMGLSIDDVGIISPYRKEVVQLRQYITNMNVAIDTIDRFQGSDKEVIVLSCPVYDHEVPLLLRDYHRLNVAMTRARSKLIVVGAMPANCDDQIKKTVTGHLFEFLAKKAVIVRDI